MDLARGSLRRRDRGEAVNAWRALVAGRWSLIDRFEADGRRYVVARLNPIGGATPKALTARERDVVRMRASAQSLKNIAAELGLGVSTISSDLRCAVGKLGLRSAAELIALANALAEPARVDPDQRE
jgi:DNA-binding NarL/FixJ family response regulator